MTEIIDRAARALALAESGVDEFDALDDAMQDTLRENVRAVLEAIREPLLQFMGSVPDSGDDMFDAGLAQGARLMADYMTDE